jgi:cation-transporting ATPase E
VKPSSVTATISKILPRIEAHAEQGLTSAQARERLVNGYGNMSPTPPEKTVGQIFRDNILTYFNLVFFVLGLLIVLVQSYRNLTFMPIIFINSTIGIIQELRSKRALSRLKFVAAPHANLVRDGQTLKIPAEDAVLDDIAIFTPGNQIYADAVVLTGECRVNEALVTGESDEIVKLPGSALLSGSFIVSGECRARLDKVGADSFVSKLTIEAKKHTKKKRTGMMGALTRLIQVIGFVIIPFGTALFLQQRLNLGHSMADSVVHTVAALVGMIPEGLYFLTSIALTISIMRLAMKRTLVHDMTCIETLARVDVLCVDKTGTITENKMSVRDVVLLCPETHDLARVSSLLSDFAAAMGADNETMLALKSRFNEPPRRRAASVLAFSSATKYSGASFSASETFLLGAPEKILLKDYDTHRPDIEKYSAQGCRVLLFARYRGPLDDKGVRGDAEPLALVILTNGIRPQAPATFRYFRQQGVMIKVISGDNALTVSAVAQEAGIENADKYVDASTLTTERKIRSAVKEYTVFGRVTPEQKRKLIRAFKAEGHTVAMTGDGVNDVLALKDADCSIAMASGSDVACRVSNIVLLDSDFSAMPSVVAEGRRVINNIERSASLFLTKNIFSFALALAALIIALPYPFQPSQIALFNIMLIGFPSFVLAIQPNTSLVRGRFLLNVILRALPAGLTNFLALLAAILACRHFGIPLAELSTMATIIIASVGLMMLYRVGRPLNLLRGALIIASAIGFTLGGLLFSGLFLLSPLSVPAIEATAVIIAAAVPLMILISRIVRMFDGSGKPPARKRLPSLPE